MRRLLLCALAGVIGCGQDDGSPDSMAEGSTGGGSTTATTSGSGSSAGSTTTSGADESTTGTSQGEESSDGSGDSSSGGDVTCFGEPAPADRERFIVLSKPYDAAGQQAATYQVFSLSEAGEIAPTDFTFDMGRSFVGRIEFTLDGQVGFVPQDDGTVGVFRLADDGAPEVLAAAFTGDFYAGRIAVSPEGRVFAIDQNTAENGGGVVELSVDCDGNVGSLGTVLSGDRIADLAWTPDALALVAARGLQGKAGSDSAFVVDVLGDGQVLDAVDAFGDQESIVSAVTLAAGGRVGLIADNSAFSKIPNRIAVVTLDGQQLDAVQTLGDLDDPYELVASPFDDTAIMVSGFGNAVFVLDVDPDATEPLSIRGELSYVGAPPQLPANAVLLERGSLEGLVLLSENTGIRSIWFEGSGAVVDQGLYDLGDGLDSIVGAIGVQP